ncbi:MAG: hypothetical protein K2W96_20440 [Gemmataceae bacterium]|nr:hypothetical protein [Gemmataceae bacterium]
MNANLMRLLAVAASLLALAKRAAADPLPPPEAAEQAALRERAAISEARIVLEVSIRDESEGGARAVEKRMWLSGDSLRSDTHLKKGEKDEQRLIVCVPCERPDSYLSTRLLVGQGHANVIALGPMSPGIRSKAMVTDPRTLGLLPIRLGVHHGHTLQSFIPPDRAAPTIKETGWKGKRCLVIESKLNDGGSRSAWVVPEWGHGVVRVEIRSTSDGKAHVASTESELAQHGPSKTWYPASTVYEESVDGKVAAREEVTVREAEFGPVDPVAFTIKGLGLPKGTPIQDKRRLLVWNGTELVKRTLPDKVTLPQPVDEPASSRSWFTILAVGFACLAALAAVFLFLKRRAEAASS